MGERVYFLGESFKIYWFFVGDDGVLPVYQFGKDRQTFKEHKILSMVLQVHKDEKRLQDAKRPTHSSS